MQDPLPRKIASKCKQQFSS